METDCIAIVLAAGQGTRMKSKKPKALQKVAGKPLTEWVTDAARKATGKAPVLVIGKDAQEVREYFGNSVKYSVQTQPLGSGHAAMAAKEFITKEGYVLVIAGDMPLIQAQTLSGIAKKAQKENLGACLMSAIAADPTGYGRILRNKNGVRGIVEHKDATKEELLINEVNASVYCFSAPLLKEALENINNDNIQEEYYLTDCVEYIAGKGHRVQAVVCSDEKEAFGVNDRVHLALAGKYLRQRINEQLMRAGVEIIDPENTYIDSTVQAGQDAVIYPGVTLEGDTIIGQGAVLYPGSRISGSVIGNETIVQNSVIIDSRVGDNSTIGPYAYLRPKSVIGNGCRVGDFVEVKNANISDGAKVSHLSYIGDGDIGEKSNIGCGVVFVNYDGKTKSRTIVGKNVFVGCNANLVAPVTIEDGAYIAAGTTVTKDVQSDALCIARSRQRNIEGWAKKRRGE